MSAVVAGALFSALIYAGLADAAASGRVIGMTSGGGSRGNGVALIRPGYGGKRHHQIVSISTPIGNVQCSRGGGSPIDCPTGGTLTATLSNNSASCVTFTTEASTWTGSGKITWAGATGTVPKTTVIKNYTLTFSPGVLYATEKGTANGDGVKDGSETGFDAFSAPPGFSCKTAGSVLTTMSVIGVLKITTK